MKSLRLKTPDTEAEVIMELFDLEPTLTYFTVIDSEGNPASVLLTRDELQTVSEWVKNRLELM